MKPAPFDYVRAETLDEALAVLAAEGGDARIIAGGQSLMAMLNTRLAKPKVLIDIMRLTELDRIDATSGTVTIGAGVRQRHRADLAVTGRTNPEGALHAYLLQRGRGLVIPG